MRSKLFSIIPFIGVGLIPQLLFWWLCPLFTTNSLSVYAFITAMSIGHLALSFNLLSHKGVRRGTAVVVVGSVIYVSMLIMACCLIAFNAEIRSSIFAMLIGVIIYVVCIASLLATMEKDGMAVNNNNSIDSNPPYSKCNATQNNKESDYRPRPLPER